MSGPTLGGILGGFAKEAPVLVGKIAEALSAAGFRLDLGPMTPDARKHFGDVDDRIAAKLDERSELDRARSRQVGALSVHVHQNDDVHDTEPPPPNASER